MTASHADHYISDIVSVLILKNIKADSAFVLMKGLSEVLLPFFLNLLLN